MVALQGRFISTISFGFFHPLDELAIADEFLYAPRFHLAVCLP
jgi:hypothetical protein